MAVADSTLVNVSCIILNTGLLVLEFSVKGKACDVGFEIVVHSSVCNKPIASEKIHKGLLLVTGHCAI